MKTTAYIRCFIDMSLYNNFNEESKAHELWEKIGMSLYNNFNEESKRLMSSGRRSASCFRTRMPLIGFRYSGS